MTWGGKSVRFLPFGRGSKTTEKETCFLFHPVLGVHRGTWGEFQSTDFVLFRYRRIGRIRRSLQYAEASEASWFISFL